MKLSCTHFIILLCTLLSGSVLADIRTTTRNAGSISASARLDFNISIGKYVMLRVGDANATQTTVTMTVALNPTLGPGNSLAYAGAFPTSNPSTQFSKTVVSSNPSTGGVIPVSAFTNVSGTTLNCTLTPLGANTPFNIGDASATGIPGTNQISIVSASGATNLQSPATTLTGCTNGSTQTIALLTLMGGSFTYTATFSSDSVIAGNYGNIVTYTATAP